MEENTVPSFFDEAAEYPQIEYATTGNRFLNFVIDSIVCYVVNFTILFTFAVGLAMAGKTADDIQQMLSNKVLSYSLGIGTYLLLYTVIEGATKGRSIGKLFTGTVAVQNNLEPITWEKAFTRTLCRLIPFEPVSGLGNAPWHDSITGTCVIKKPRTAV